ncbi:SMP-30/gluconolactonase/LRE family protein [Sphingobacterium siyangense]|uniref:Major royal jelly protein n=1 Tax=Sphingobacterium siyangense TaxID=459529 RepID=A0A562MFX1_9SPHI|nr:L-dopachrome tautomerase-related protein [Sphingobacterium siyangense]TWI18845.1 major royal jelly protein [Sphingobacterium siyangense]
MKKILSILALSGGIFFYANAQNQTKMETVFEDNTYQLTGVAVSKSGRVFTNYPRWAGPYQYAVVEILKDGTKKPFPNEEWNTWDVEKGGDKQHHFIGVQAVVADNEDNLWVVDPGYAKNADGEDKGQKLVKISLKNNQVERIYPLSSVTSAKSYMNDTRIDTKQQIAYITNSSEGGIVIVDLKLGNVRQVLKGNPVMLADTTYSMKRNGKELLSNGKPFRVHSDGIALSPDKKYLYFKTLTDDKLFRAATADLNNTSLSEKQLADKVEFLGHFTTTDGMETDSKGNLYLGDLEKRRIVRISPELKMTEIVSPNEELAWPDSYQITADGWMYVSCSRIDEEGRFGNERKGAYKIIRIKID